MSSPSHSNYRASIKASRGIWRLVDLAAERDPNFDFAEALFQVAIVLGSVSIVAASRALVKLSGGLAVVASLLMTNGYFLIVLE
ncbi:MAG TPA: DUF4337 family protein [Stellaceae bacterium]